MLRHAGVGTLMQTSDIRALSKVSSWRALVTLFAEWSIIGLAIAISEHFKNIPVYILSWILVGSRMYALYSLLHDGIHYLLFPRKQVNDWICRIFLAWPLFISFTRIRKYHLAHHQNLKTPDDPEAVHLQYSEFQFPQSAASLAFTFLKDITGINYILYKSSKAVRSFSLVFKKTESKGKHSVMPVEPGMIIYFAIVAGVLFYTGCWVKFAMYWIFPYITIYQALNRLRLSTEHFHLPEDKSFQTRTVKLSLVQSLLFSPHNLGYHAEHHLYPSVPFYRLPTLHNRLMKEDTFKANVVVSKSYFQVIKEYIK